MDKPSIEVIMAAYNQVVVTKLVLDGYLRQTDKNFSICIADDGSDACIEHLVKTYQKLGLSIRHVWQEDKGFRRAKIINKAIASSTKDFIILTDNDCIPSSHFIANYKSQIENDKFIIGRRVDLYASLTEKLISHVIPISLLDDPLFLLSQALKKGLKRPEIGLRPPRTIAKLWSHIKRKKGALGANMGVFRDALLKINGFDEDFEGYGFEEVDLERRLIQTGNQPKVVLGACALFHLYHPEKSANDFSQAIFEQKQSEGLLYCRNGIHQPKEAPKKIPEEII